MSTTRRHFLGASAAAGWAAPYLQAQRKLSPNDTIQFALIGAGGMGSGDANSALGVGGTKLVAVADIYDGRLVRAKEVWGKDVATTRDYREILARPDVDAVIIGTPDHWHQRISVDAMNAGKDVYCEKPMIQRVDDGKPVVEAQKSTGRIIQIGSQRVSSVVYEKARQLLAQGAIGKLNLIEAWWDRNSAIGAWEYSIPPDASPANIDWDRFLGRTPKVPFDPPRLFRWRNYRDYGTGVAGDLFVHLFSGMHYVTGAIGPTRVYATGGQRFWKDRDVPDVMLGLYDYPATEKLPAFNLSLRVNFVNGAGETSGFRFVGSEGIMTIGNGVSIARQPARSRAGLHHRHVSESGAGRVSEGNTGRSIRRNIRTPTRCVRSRKSTTFLRRVTAITWIITATSSVPCERASPWWRMPRSDSAPLDQRCSPTSVISNTGSANGTRAR